MVQKTITEPIIHKDILGQEINVGDFVASAKSNAIQICKVTKLNPKMIKVFDIKSVRKNEWLVYAKETVKLTSQDALLYILKYE